MSRLFSMLAKKIILLISLSISLCSCQSQTLGINPTVDKHFQLSATNEAFNHATNSKIDIAIPREEFETATAIALTSIEHKPLPTVTQPVYEFPIHIRGVVDFINSHLSEGKDPQSMDQFLNVSNTEVRVETAQYELDLNGDEIDEILLLTRVMSIYILNEGAGVFIISQSTGIWEVHEFYPGMIISDIWGALDLQLVDDLTGSSIPEIVIHYGGGSRKLYEGYLVIGWSAFDWVKLLEVEFERPVSFSISNIDNDDAKEIIIIDEPSDQSQQTGLAIKYVYDWSGRGFIQIEP